MANNKELYYCVKIYLYQHIIQDSVVLKLVTKNHVKVKYINST